MNKIISWFKYLSNLQLISIRVSNLKAQPNDDLFSDKHIDLNLMPLKTNKTFDNFLSKESNQNSVEFLKGFSNGKSDSNFITLYGDYGSGKTHLLYSVVNELKIVKPEINVLFFYGPDLFDSILQGIRNFKLIEVKNKIYESDLIIIDDVDCFAKGHAVQEELKTILKRFINHDKKIILTLNKSRKNEDGFSADLESVLNESVKLEI